MSAAAEPANKTLQHALKLGAKGYPVFPCKPFSKAPATEHGLLDASTDPDQIRAWFDNKRGFNLAVRCGECPNEVNLLAVDIDPKNGGVETWAALVAEHGTPLAPRHETPSGGFHLFFDTPQAWSSVHSLGPGIDTRGVGGYVVVPPSRLTNDDGEIIVYATRREVALVENQPPPPPSWVRPPAPSAPVVRASSVDGDGVFDRVRLAWRGWDVELPVDGWSAAGAAGGDVRWTRPGKSPREGHSASVKADGGLRVFTETRPPGGKPMQRGQGVTYSPGEYALHYRCGGDFSALGRLYPSARAVPWVAQPVSLVPSAKAESWRLPVVEASYWEACERNRRIFQAARARRVSPDALDAVIYAMQSLLIPPQWRLETLVGGEQPINMLTCLVAGTGDFKSSTMDAAWDLMGPLPPWVEAINMGSGEGIGATFLKDEMEANAKSGKQQKTGRLVRNDIRAAFFEADEGSGLSQAAKRQGATIIANLCKGWSGRMLGEGNASAVTRRKVERLDYRLAAVINIQPSNFAELFSMANTQTGLTGRFLFSGTLDGDIPDVKPEWPGPFEWPQLPQMPVTIRMDPAVAAAADAAIVARHRTSSLNGNGAQTAQAPATLGRMAAILAVAEGRQETTERDWLLAGQRAAASTACLDMLDRWAQHHRSVGRHTADRVAGQSAATQKLEEERVLVGNAADRILAVLDGQGPMAKSAILEKMTRSTRPYRDDALTALAEMGKVREIEPGRWVKP